MDVVIRQATAGDKDFIIKAIKEASKSGGDMISYCAIFNITEDHLTDILSNILDEDVDGQELCIASYLIADINGKSAATVGSWVEMENGMAGNIITSNLLMHFIDRDIIIKAEPALRLMKETNIAREPGALQIEITYLNDELMLQLAREEQMTAKELREINLITKLIDEHIRLKAGSNKTITKAQSLLFESNIRSVRANQKAGFVTVSEKKCDNESILDLLPCNTRILMERNLN